MLTQNIDDVFLEKMHFQSLQLVVILATCSEVCAFSRPLECADCLQHAVMYGSLLHHKEALVGLLDIIENLF